MKRKSLITVALLCLVAFCLAAVAGILGKWSGTVITPDGHRTDIFYNFETSAGQLTGTAVSQGTELKLENGKLYLLGHLLNF
jgi:hypothetical protein